MWFSWGSCGCFNIQAENTTNFDSISTDDMDLQSVNNKNPVQIPRLQLKTFPGVVTAHINRACHFPLLVIYFFFGLGLIKVE
jgi:hypothetical protein